MPNETGEIRHQLLNDLETHALYVGVIAFVFLVGIIMTILVVDDARRRGRERRAWAARAAAERTTRAAGVAEGFERGWHG